MKKIQDSTGNDLIPVVALEGGAVDKNGRLIVNGASLVDTVGNVMPTGMPTVYTNRRDGQPLTATKTDGTDTWVYSWTYDDYGYCIGESDGWVKQ